MIFWLQLAEKLLLTILDYTRIIAVAIFVLKTTAQKSTFCYRKRVFFILHCLSPK